jgi:flagellar biosynthetic protein FliR
MNTLYPTTELGYLGVLLVFFRLLGLFLVAPGFSHSAIPFPIKILTALTISLALFPIVRTYVPVDSHSLSGYLGSVARESAIGFLMGFVAYVTFESISLGAQFVGYQMGLGTASMMDPENNQQVSAMVPFQAWIALMVFFIGDMHHHVIQVFAESFRITQGVTDSHFSNPALLQFFIGITTKLFILAVQLSAPITLLVLSCNLVIGMLSRIMPQMNILLFSFPITIFLGFAGLYLIAPEMIDTVENVLAEVSNELMAFVRLV